MQRSVIQLAGKTLVVSLPSAWCRQNGVKKGSTVELVPLEHSCVINPGAGKARWHVTLPPINATNAWYLLQAAYRDGATDLTIPLNRTGNAALLRGIIKELPGWEIVRQHPTSIEVKEISVPKQEQLDILIQRAVHMVVGYAADCAACADTTELRQLAQYGDDPINRITDLCMRMSLTATDRSAREQVHTALFIHNIEKIGDLIRNNAILSLEHPHKDIIGLLRRQAEAVKEYSQLFFSHQEAHLERIIDTRRALLPAKSDLKQGVAALCKELAQGGADILMHLPRPVDTTAQTNPSQ